MLWSRIDKFTHAMLGNLSPTGVNWARAGTVVLAIGAAMSAAYGWQVSVLHAVGLAGVTFIAAFGIEAAYQAHRDGKWIVSGFAGVLGVFFLVIQFGIDQQYTAGARGNNRDETRVANVKYDNAHESAKDDVKNLAMWREHMARLQTEAPWAATVKADALRSELEALTKRMVDEERGQRGRKAGRGKIYEDLESQAIAVTAKIGKVEQATKLAEQIEATQRILDKKRETANGAEFKSSAVVHGNGQIAKAISFAFGGGALKASDAIEAGTDIGINSAIALAISCGHAFCFLMAVALYGRREDHIDAPAHTAAAYRHTITPTPLQHSPYGIAAPTHDSHVHIPIQITDAVGLRAEALRTAILSAIQQQRTRIA